ncbi:hypothetical protein BKI52_09705 [marine bacterium AO1-C]|nr:hypothetical protein BKI52_09705 [marine bacterium AO1-C]
MFFLPLALLFLGGEYIITQGLQKSNYNFYKEWNEITKGKVNADVIINGSSRAWVHVSPKILDSVLKVNAYNLGFNDLEFRAQYHKFQEYLMYNAPPKIVVQTLDVFSLKSRDYLFDPAQYLPFFTHPSVRKCTQHSSLFSKVDFYLPLIRYFKYRSIAKLGVKEFFSPSTHPNTRYKGYKGLDRTWTTKVPQDTNMFHQEKVIPIAKYNIQLLDRFLKECQQQKIKVVLVYPPEFIDGQSHHINRREVMKIYQSLAKKYKVKLLDYSQDEISHQKQLFYNVQHLNRKGAETFSKKLALDIQKLIN